MLMMPVVFLSIRAITNWAIISENTSLVVCYAMKEMLCVLFELNDPLAAYEGWKRWFDAAEASGISAFVKFEELSPVRDRFFLLFKTGILHELNRAAFAARFVFQSVAGRLQPFHTGFCSPSDEAKGPGRRSAPRWSPL